MIGPHDLLEVEAMASKALRPFTLLYPNPTPCLA
ncbi:hypothetical protein ABIB25_005898 [Nakamurella sp. UYEF19]